MVHEEFVHTAHPEQLQPAWGGTELNCKHNFYAQGLRGLWTTEHCSRRTWEVTWHSKFRVCFLTVNKTADVFSCWPAWWGTCLPNNAAQPGSPHPVLAEAKEDCLLLPTLPVLLLLQCLVQSDAWVHFTAFIMEFFHNLDHFVRTSLGCDCRSEGEQNPGKREGAAWTNQGESNFIPRHCTSLLIRNMHEESTWGLS